MNVLVTGGGGFLGAAIVKKLLERENRVSILSRGDYPHLRQQGATLVRGDINDLDTIRVAMKGCDAVVHSAAMVGMWGSYQDFYKTNVLGTRTIIETCRQLNIGKLVHTSSPSVAYGRQGCEGIDESAPYPEEYDSFYSRTKAEAERLVIRANDATLATCALRPHLIWGPEDNHLVTRIVARARSGRLRIVGDGKNLIDSIYIDNAAEAHLLALDRLDTNARCAGKTYFLSQDQPLPAVELINRIVQAAGLPPVTRHVPVGVAAFIGGCLESGFRLFGKTEEPPMTRFIAYQLSTPHWFDISAAKQDLDYSPRISINEGMIELANWFASTATHK